MTEHSKFLNQKTRVQTVLASTNDKASLINQLSSMLQLLQQQEQTPSTSQTNSAPPLEKDDDEEFVIDLNED